MPKNLFILFMLYLGINSILRYPTNLHEHGSDSFYNHVVTLQVLSSGFYNNYVNLFSYFGLYPFSMNSGGIFLLGSFTLTTGLDIHFSIFLLELILVLVSGFPVFLISYRLKPDILVAISAAILYTTSRDILVFTSWTFSFRGPYISLFPIFFLMILRFISNRNLKEFTIMSIFLFILFTIHRLAFLNVLILVAYLLTLLINHYTLKLSPKSQILLSRHSVLLKILFLFFVYLLVLLGYTFYTTQYERTVAQLRNVFFDNNNLIFSIINLGMMHSMAFGLLIIFTPLGLLYICNKRNKINLFVYLALTSFGLVWVDSVYAIMIFIFFSSILASHSFFFLKDHFPKFNFFKPYFIVVILLVQYLPEHITVHKSEYTYLTEDDDFYNRNTEIKKANEAGLYSSNFMQYVITSHTVSSTRIVAYSNEPLKPALNSVHPTVTYFDAKPISIFNFLTGDHDYLFVLTNDELIHSQRYDLLLTDIKVNEDMAIDLLDDIHLGDGQYIFALYSRNPTMIQDDFNVWQSSIFLESVIEYDYKVYDNGFHNYFFINENDL